MLLHCSVATVATLGLFAAHAAGAPTAAARTPFESRPDSYRHYWQYRGTDCDPGIELGNCSDTHAPPYSIQECKAACLATPNCGGFNLPNGHLKKLGCMEAMQHTEEFANLDLYVLNEYPPQRNYWWRATNFDCNPGVEIGSCGRYMDACKEACVADPVCAGFNLPNGHLKAMDCLQDIVDAGNWSHPQDLYVLFHEPEPRRTDSSLEFVLTEGADCNLGRELGNCSTYLPPPYTASECAAACRNNPLCAGFNLPNGHLKTVDCQQDVIRKGVRQDLYLILDASPRTKQQLLLGK